MKTTAEIVGEAVLGGLIPSALVRVVELVDDLRSASCAPGDMRGELEREALRSIRGEVAGGMRGDMYD